MKEYYIKQCTGTCDNCKVSPYKATCSVETVRGINDYYMNNDSLSEDSKDTINQCCKRLVNEIFEIFDTGKCFEEQIKETAMKDECIRVGPWLLVKAEGDQWKIIHSYADGELMFKDFDSAFLSFAMMV